MVKFCDRSFTPCCGWCNPYLSLVLKLNLKKEFFENLRRIFLPFGNEGLRHSNHSVNGNWIVERAGDRGRAKSVSPPRGVLTRLS